MKQQQKRNKKNLLEPWFQAKLCKNIHACYQKAYNQAGKLNGHLKIIIGAKPKEKKKYSQNTQFKLLPSLTCWVPKILYQGRQIHLN